MLRGGGIHLRRALCTFAPTTPRDPAGLLSRPPRLILTVPEESSTPLQFVRPSDINPRLSTLSLTASYLAGTPLRDLELVLPTISPRVVECPSATKAGAVVVLPDPAPKVIEAPPRTVDPMVDPTLPSQPVRKEAQRMLIIRKRKMKVHQRRKRKRKFFARYRRVQLQRAKKRECAYRITLMERVTLAKKFDPERYVAEYLDDLHRPLIPKTFKGKRLPEFLIKELQEKEVLERRTTEAEKLDIITKEPLVMPGETVEQFVKRVGERNGWVKTSSS